MSIRSLTQILSAVLLLSSYVVTGQTFGNIDHIYKDNVKTVQFFNTTDPEQTNSSGISLNEMLFSDTTALAKLSDKINYPFIQLNAPQYLVLTFDDLDADSKNYYYRIEHCNADWQKSELNDAEFMRGFNNEQLRDYVSSTNTEFAYTHYKLALPNNNIKWLVTGNYLLHIYDFNSNDPVLTRRFIVYEPIMKIIPTKRDPSDVTKLNTHQEFDITINHKGTRVYNPQNDLKISVIQNGNWRSEIKNLRPLYTRGDEELLTYQDKIIFAAGKDFRTVDLRSLRFRSENVTEVRWDQGEAYIIVTPQNSRVNSPYTLIFDLNGGFIIMNSDQPNYDPEIYCDYAHVVYTLKSPKLDDNIGVFVVGGFTDYELKRENMLQYDESLKAYTGQILMKQGRYDYLFYAANLSTGEILPYQFEGNSYEANDLYTFIVYHRNLGDRYDRVVGVFTTTSY